MNAEEHIEAAEAWLETGETSWRRFTHDNAPRDPGELRKAEVAIGLSRAHSALAAAVVSVPVTVEHRAPNGFPSPVSPAAAPETSERH